MFTVPHTKAKYTTTTRGVRAVAQIYYGVHHIGWLDDAPERIVAEVTFVAPGCREAFIEDAKANMRDRPEWVKDEHLPSEYARQLLADSEKAEIEAAANAPYPPIAPAPTDPKQPSVNASNFFQRVESLMATLAGRWQDEGQYEDIKEYTKPIQEVANHYGVTITGMTKRPFGCTFTVDGRTYKLTLSGSKYAYKRTA